MHPCAPSGTRRRRLRASRRARLTAAAAAACLSVLATPAAASAHATLLRTVPATGAVVDREPARLLLEFDEQVEPVAGATVVVSASGRPVTAGPPHPSAANARVLVIPLRSHLPDGDYTIRWSVVSADGHIESGVFAIGVGAGRPPPQATTSLSSPFDWPFVVARFAYFAGLTLLVGGAVFRAVVLLPVLDRLPPGVRRAAELRERRRATPLFLLASVLMLGGGWVALNRQGAEVAGVSFWQVFNHAGPIPSALQATRFGRVFGRGIDLGAALVVALSVTWIVRRRSRVAGLVAGLAATGLGVWSTVVPGLSGHAGDPRLGWPAVGVDALHTLAACVWVGGLAQIVRVVPHATGSLPPEHRGSVRSAVAGRFSAIALGCVAVLAATGAGRALWEVGRLSQLVSTGYGRTLVVKSLLFAGAVAVAAANRRRIGVFARLRTATAVEFGLLGVVIAAVALLTELPPAVRPATVTAAAAGGAASIGGLPAPAGARYRQLRTVHGQDVLASGPDVRARFPVRQQPPSSRRARAARAAASPHDLSGGR